MTRIWSKEALSYAFYDFANSSYALLILTFIYGVYFKQVIMQDALNADLMWGIVTAVPVIIAAVLSPLLGALADNLHHKKLYLVLSTLITVLFTALLATVGPGEVTQGMILVILASIFYYFSTLFYDAFIIDVADRNSVGKISGFSWGLGYVGGLAALLAVHPLIKQGFAPENLLHYRFSFVVTALFFLVFSLPMFFFVKQKIFSEKIHGWTKSFRQSFNDISAVWKERKMHRNFFLLILAFFFYNDALSTLFAFTAIFAQSTIGMKIAEISTLMFVVQFIAFPASWFFGALADIIGQKTVIMGTLSFVLVFASAAAFTTSKGLFFLFICLAALGIGASQSCTRAFIRQMIPEHKSAQFFGFQSFLGKFSAFLGPLLYGFISFKFLDERIAFSSVAVFLIIGMVLLVFVKESSS